MSQPGIDVARIAADDDALAAFVENSVAGMAHRAGACCMGRRDDPGFSRISPCPREDRRCHCPCVGEALRFRRPEP